MSRYTSDGIFTNQSLVQMIKDFREKEDELLKIKAGEYSIGDDRLWNFNQQALIEGREPVEVALTLLTKHYLALVKMVTEKKFNWCWTTLEGTEGGKQRLVDLINYIYLLAGCIEDYLNKEEKSCLQLPLIPGE